MRYSVFQLCSEGLGGWIYLSWPDRKLRGGFKGEVLPVAVTLGKSLLSSPSVAVCFLLKCCKALLTFCLWKNFVTINSYLKKICWHFTVIVVPEARQHESSWALSHLAVHFLVPPAEEPAQKCHLLKSTFLPQGHLPQGHKYTEPSSLVHPMRRALICVTLHKLELCKFVTEELLSVCRAEWGDKQGWGANSLWLGFIFSENGIYLFNEGKLSSLMFSGFSGCSCNKQ